MVISLETSAGENRAKAGGTMTVPPDVPMELSITGTVLRKSFVLEIHDSSQPPGYAFAMEADRHM